MSGFKKIIAAGRFKKAFNAGAEICTAGWEIAKDPRPVNIALNAAKLAEKSLAGYVDQYTAETIQRDWVTVRGIPSDLVPSIMRIVLSSNPSFKKEKQEAVLSEVFGIPVALVYRVLYTPNGTDQNELCKGIARILIETSGPRYSLSKIVDPLHGGVCLNILPSTEAQSSSSTVEVALIARIKKFRDKGFHRSLILYGPPGTGKSIMAANIAAELGPTCMTVPAEIFFNYNLIGLIEVLCPDTIIVNDANYVSEVDASALSMIEDVVACTKLLIATANTIKIDPALIRPGRFDETKKIEVLGDKFYSELIRDITRLLTLKPDVEKELRSWPAAFLFELNRRVVSLGSVCFQEEYEELLKRVLVNKTELGEKSLFDKSTNKNPRTYRG